MKQSILKLQSLEQRILEYDSQLEPMIKKVNILNDKTVHIEEQMVIENKEHKHLNEDLEFVTKQCDDLAKDIEYLIKEGKTLESKIEELDINHGQGDKELTALMKDNDMLDDDCHTLQ